MGCVDNKTGKKNWGTATYVFMQIKWERKYG